MRTGTGAPLSTQTVPFTGTSILNLNFGFATDERPQPGVILDSFTISITGPDGTSYLVTVDGNGTQWTPNVPGSLPVASSSLQWQTSPFLVPTMGLTNLTSYMMGYTLPANWQGTALTVNFDLFDNQNSLQSLGYFLISVPEPSAAALLVLALAVWFRRRSQ